MYNKPFISTRTRTRTRKRTGSKTYEIATNALIIAGITAIALFGANWHGGL